MNGIDIAKIKKEICSSIEIEEKGNDRYLIHTGFTYHDGDELRVVLEMINGKYRISDEGHTMMWFSYSDYTFTELRTELLNRILKSNSVCIDEGEIYIECVEEEIGKSLDSFVQALMQITDLSFLSSERVANTFVEDLKEFVSSMKNGIKCSFDKSIITPEGDKRNIDIVIESPSPIYVLGVSNKDKCKDAIITILAMRENPEFKSVAVIDEGAEIPKKDVNMLVNHADRPIVGEINEAKELLQKYIEKSFATA